MQLLANFLPVFYYVNPASSLSQALVEMAAFALARGDEVRTADLAQSRENLSRPVSHGLNP
ncbi:hypothetical protein ACFORL_00340 [Legionella dresdenensis]|uniref:Uncharacterized protein n=1 Tax=Legionella dresdenensis TaxID=450200 RepID=A0ABV8CC64_9GAMM